MVKKGGATRLSPDDAQNLELAKKVLREIANRLEAEYTKLGSSTVMSRSLRNQLVEFLESRNERLTRLMRPVYEHGSADDEYNELFERSRVLTDRMMEYNTDEGGRRKTRRQRRRKSTRKVLRRK